MRHTEYVNYFRQIAESHVDIQHSDTEMHFARIVINAASQRDPFGSFSQIREFITGKGSKLKYPAMILVAYHGNYADNRSDAKRKQMDGSFILLDKIREGDHDGEELLYDRLELMGEEIVAKCSDDFEENPRLGIFDMNNVESEKIAKVASDLFGVKFYFTIDKPYNSHLNVNPDKFI